MAFTYRDVVAAAGVGEDTTAQLLTSAHLDQITAMATGFGVAPMVGTTRSSD